MIRSPQQILQQTRTLALLIAASISLIGVCVSSSAQPPTLNEESFAGISIPDKKDVIVLFSGKPEELAQNWEQGGKPAQWPIQDGALIAAKSDIRTRQKFTDFQLHVEFRVPYLPNEKGQARGNSGVYLQDHYEIQILDSYGIADPGRGDCGSLYNTTAPLFNACRPPMQWQTYDIVFRAPRFDPSTRAMTMPGHVTVIQNGITVQNATEITHGTHVVARKKNPDGTLGPEPPAEDLTGPGSIRLQYHHSAVAFRNIWIIPLPDHGASHY